MANFMHMWMLYHAKVGTLCKENYTPVLPTCHDARLCYIFIKGSTCHMKLFEKKNIQVESCVYATICYNEIMWNFIFLVIFSIINTTVKPVLSLLIL